MLVEIFNIYVFVEAVWLILPAYAANGLVPLFRGKRRLDFGKKFRDGRPLLGKGKTIEGLVGGCLVGTVIGLIQQLAFPYLPWGLSEVFLILVPMSPLLGFLLGFGAIAGDSAASFLKRRIGIKSGSPAPILDQLDFVIGAFIFASILVSIRLEWYIIMIVLTPIFHWTACVIGYLLRIKKNPW
jgi:CDP-2,3-bis-(O-geranylgeranyl)-sn-glycerol synthase